eukprot:756792-Hanusia_phi.AAC.4
MGAYVGQWSAGLFHGKGSYKYPDGEKFEGSFQLSCPVSGILEKPNGTRAEVIFDGSSEFLSLVRPSSVPEFEPGSVFDPLLKPLDMKIIDSAQSATSSNSQRSSLTGNSQPMTVVQNLFSINCICHQQPMEALNGYHIVQDQQRFWDVRGRICRRRIARDGQLQVRTVRGRTRSDKVVRWLQGQEFTGQFNQGCPIGGVFVHGGGTFSVTFDGKTKISDPSLAPTSMSPVVMSTR